MFANLQKINILTRADWINFALHVGNSFLAEEYSILNNGYTVMKRTSKVQRKRSSDGTIGKEASVKRSTAVGSLSAGSKMAL